MNNPYQPPQTPLSTKKNRPRVKWGWLVYAVFFDVFAIVVYTMERMKESIDDYRVIDWLDFPFLILLCSMCIAYAVNRKIFGKRFWKTMLWIIFSHAVYSVSDHSWTYSSLSDAGIIAAVMILYYLPHTWIVWHYAYGKNNLWTGASSTREGR